MSPLLDAICYPMLEPHVPACSSHCDESRETLASTNGGKVFV